MRRSTRIALRTLCTSVMLARPNDALTLPALLRHLTNKEGGIAIAEYAIGTLVAAAFAGLLLALMRPGSLNGVLQSTIEQAFSVRCALLSQQMDALAPEQPRYPAVTGVIARVPFPAGPPAVQNRIPHLVAGPDGATGVAIGVGAPEGERRGW